MNGVPTYTIARGDEKYGPYTLDQLRDYVKQGSVRMNDLVWTPGMKAWVPLSEVLGSASDAGAPPAQLVPPPIPGSPYATPQMPTAHAAGAAALPKPPSLHWALVLLISILTCGIFGLVWMFLQSSWVRRLEPTNNALIILAVGIPAQFVLSLLAALSDEQGLGVFAYVVGFVATEVAYFSMREVLQNKYALRLSPIMTFFFTVLYFQYHMTRIAEGQVPATGR